MRLVPPALTTMKSVPYEGQVSEASSPEEQGGGRGPGLLG